MKCLIVFALLQLVNGALYGVDGAGARGNKALWKINPKNAAVTEVGPVDVAAGFGLQGLSFDPITCNLWATSNSPEDRGSTLAGELLKLNQATGEVEERLAITGWVIGKGITTCRIPDISFDSTGVLYAWCEREFNGGEPIDGDFLITIDLATGLYEKVGCFCDPSLDLNDDCCNTFQTGLAFSQKTGKLYLRSGGGGETQGGVINEINPATGEIVGRSNLLIGYTLTGISTLTSDSKGRLYGLADPALNSATRFVNFHFLLTKLNPRNTNIAPVIVDYIGGENRVPQMSALAWEPETCLPAKRYDAHAQAYQTQQSY